MIKLNEAAIKEAAEENDTSKEFFSYLRKRERHRGDTDLTRLHRQLNVSREGLERVCKRLADAGVGELIERPGRHKKFHWYYSPVRVAETVFGRRTSAISIPQPRYLGLKRLVVKRNGTEVELLVEPDMISSIVRDIGFK